MPKVAKIIVPAQRFEQDFDGFVAYLLNPANPALISPERFADAIGIELKTLGAKARIHVDTIKRSPNAESVQFFLMEAIRVIHAASGPLGSIDDATQWIKGEKLDAFDAKTGLEVIANGDTEKLLDHIQTF